MSSSAQNAMQVRPIQFGTAEYQETLELRNRLLRIPLGLNLFDEDLAAEQQQWHFGLYDGAALVGCVVAVPTAFDAAKIRQMVIDTSRQSQGGGKTLLSAVESHLQSKGIRHIVLHARVQAQGFYDRLGYRVTGEEFTEVGIPHVEMRKSL